jgi:hypothetical protein
MGTEGQTRDDDTPDSRSEVMPGEDWWIVLDTQVTFVTDPVEPCADQQFSVSWQEINAGTGPSGPYSETFQMNASGQDWNQSDNYDEPVQPGESVTRTMWFTLPANTYNMNLEIDGTAGYLGNVIVKDCSSGSGDSSGYDQGYSEGGYEQSTDEWAYSENYTEGVATQEESQSQY